MRCKACGFYNARGVKFCGECGAALKLKCSSCEFENAPGIKFCGECGKPLAEATKPAPPREPRAYTPKHLAEKILTSRSALEGERKQVTVLFADVKGSMDLAEQVDPEEWHTILDRFFQILTDGVHRFEGTVNQYTGDGIMALFGAPMDLNPDLRIHVYQMIKLGRINYTVGVEIPKKYLETANGQKTR